MFVEKYNSKNTLFLLSIKGEALNSFWKGDHIGRTHVRLQKSLRREMMMMIIVFNIITWQYHLLPKVIISLIVIW